MFKQIIKVILFFVILGNISTSVLAHNFRAEYTYSQDEKQSSQIIKLNTIERYYYGSYKKTLSHRYKETYRYSEYRKVTKPRFLVLEPRRAAVILARNYWP